MSEPLHRALGLTDDEAAEIERILGRRPNSLELAMYAVMWSEHCSYKSSRLHLRRLPTAGEGVLVGPGENAGVVDVGDGIAVAMRIESHNHPSAIEPYQGAATGVGGILRDIFTMGARPIAVMDPLRFGPLDDPRSRWIAEGVVSGISGYGNSVGVPTVGGEAEFDETYRDNPLVNVFCLGVLPVENLVLGRATGVGNLAVLVGAGTGRDGIGGVSVLASAGFSEGEDESAKRPSVQVGDPFEEKRLIEACLALYDAGLVVGIQDLGGAGLTCATSETASRAGMGMDVDISAVRRREPDMEPFEVMTSESQERMLAIVTPQDLDEVLAVCRKWEVSAGVIGRVTSGGSLRVLDGFGGEVLADIPAASLHDDAPCYDRPRTPPARDAQGDDHVATTEGVDLGEDLLAMLLDTSWVWRQYDHQLFLNTVLGPGSDATLLRLKHPLTGRDTGRGLALTTDGNHRWCSVDPRQGTAMVVAEAVMNLATVGARPVALVNCLNFGNPEHGEVMWQLSEAIDGMAEACRAFAIPVVGGNVSLYNESGGADIAPTPVVGMLGLVDGLDVPPPTTSLVDGSRLILIGDHVAALGGSRWAFERGQRGGPLPPLDLRAHSRVATAVRDLVNGGLVNSVHDVSAGGLGLCLAEMAVRSGVGFNVAGIHGLAELFGESPSRCVVGADPELAGTVLRVCESAGAPTTELGFAGGAHLHVEDLLEVSLTEASSRYHDRLPSALGAGTTQG
ncbi:MAG: Phosphoribosylformylglycinamidine synthase subunit PurL [Acidimicrobiales bacterium]|nr:MAG: phosphoribosylformylglycinamidine synthase subunit PurL [Actinomycetota bacterium]MBV6507432.1 Phosphoribosylformylglycinamidine synthase subunit PurL [Acidimicrobiales bacterium]RIK07813.1 MAG: phosphoribosylformylglycinamidine synthase subunit PurL [Acidobacteriota bacterium]